MPVMISVAVAAMPKTNALGLVSYRYPTYCNMVRFVHYRQTNFTNRLAAGEEDLALCLNFSICLVHFDCSFALAMTD